MTTNVVVKMTEGIGTPFLFIIEKTLEKGNPLSRAKAYDILDEAVNNPCAVNAIAIIGNIFAQKGMIRIKLAKTMSSIKNWYIYIERDKDR